MIQPPAMHSKRSRRSKSFYITVFTALFNFSLCFFIIFTSFKTKNFLANLISISLILFFLVTGIKKFKQRNEDIIYDTRRVMAAVILMLVIAAFLIFIAPNRPEKRLTPEQKAKMIIR